VRNYCLFSLFFK